MKAKILIAEEDQNFAEVLRGIMRRLDNRVKVCDDLEGVRQSLAAEPWDMLLCSAALWHSSRGGKDILELARTVVPAVPVAITVDYARQHWGEEAIGAGAFTWLLKPCRAEAVIHALETAQQLKAEEQQTVAAPAPAPSADATRHFGLLVGESLKMQELYRTIEKVAATDFTVLLRGESGTGKELVAKAIHRLSTRRGRPFVAVNCASLSDQLLESELFGHVKGAFTGAVRNKEGLFQTAAGGTLFLDEIGTVSPNLQQSLLRVLENKVVRPVGSTETLPVDVRVIAATNENLEQRIQDGSFRLDLFHRLNILPIALPPLRERREDIATLVNSFVDTPKTGKCFSAEAIRLLENFAWPGNVRQLENIVLRMVALSPAESTVLDVENLPEEIRATIPKAPAPMPPPSFGATLSLKAYLKACERHYLKFVLEQSGGDKTAAAKALGISLATFYRKYEEV
ncbi:MAG: sigma-54-dependent Fis family transcriptional regulator [Victivallales bacterium]|nr:sigma-54-dependent Fis family transcriptional regulator [Victivallales bacterium]